MQIHSQGHLHNSTCLGMQPRGRKWDCNYIAKSCSCLAPSTPSQQILDTTAAAQLTTIVQDVIHLKLQQPTNLCMTFYTSERPLRMLVKA